MANEALEADAVYREQGFGTQRIGYGDRPALLIVDMQHDFVDPEAPSTCAPMAQEALPHIRRLLDKARKVGIPVFFSRGLVHPTLADVGFWKSRAHAEGRVQLEGTRGAEIVDELAPRPTEHVVGKRRPSAFFETDLEVFLRGHRTDTLIIAGSSASGCVRATVYDSFSRDYRTIIPQECVIDRARSVLEANLFDMNAKYADVVDLDEVIDYLERVAGRAEQASRG